MDRRKIALVGFHLYGGGTARVMSNLSKIFHQNNIEVHTIIIHDEIGYEYEGKLFNLGKLKSKKNTIFNKIKRFFALKKYIQKNNFDFVIDFRFRKRILQEFLISKFVYNPKKTIFTIHSSDLEIYLPKSKFWTKAIYGKAYNIIAITKEMKKMVENKYPMLNNVSFIYNPVDKSIIETKKDQSIHIEFDFIIGIGHFDTEQKQFDKLIESYAKSVLPRKNINLVILGRGEKRKELEYMARKMSVENLVHFLGFQDNPYAYISKAKAFILSSLHEGHPMVLIEALACGIPVVSFDCPTGPREIIAHRDNGLLIENQNMYALTEGINIIITDEVLYKRCKENSFKSIKKFSFENIGNQWLSLMNINN